MILTLTRDLQTPIGTYAAGTNVAVAHRVPGGYVIRLPRIDPRIGFSYTITLPASYLQGRP